MATSVDAYLLSLEAARAANLDLPPAAPNETERLAALVVFARIVANAHPSRNRQLFEVYVPKVLKQAPGMLHFESRVEQLITPEGAHPPECLRCHDLRPRQVGGAYRQAQVTKEPDFHGHLFGDTIDQGIDGLERFLLGHPGGRLDVRAWAWPLLVLRYFSLGAEPATTAVVLETKLGGVEVIRSQPAE